MTATRRHRTPAARLLAVILPAAHLMSFAAGAEAGIDSREIVPARTALIVFVSYEGAIPLPVHPGDLRSMATDALTEALQERGHTVFTYPDIEAPMRQWRVRSARNVSEEFLGAVRTAHGADRLAVVRLIVYPARMILLARVMSTDAGRLIWAGVQEGDWDEGFIEEQDVAEAWSRAIAASCSRLLARWRDRVPAGARESLLVLPADADGVEQAPTDVAVHCLLSALLEAGGWSIPDPAVVVAALWNDGYSPSGLDDGSRTRLMTRFGPRTLLVPRLISFEQSFASRPARAAGEEDRPSIALDEDVKIPLHFSVVAVDCATGAAVFAADRYVEPENPEGVFGMEKSIRLTRRLQKGADRLVRDLTQRNGVR